MLSVQRVLALAAIICSLHTQAQPIPDNATKTIAKVKSAAQSRNFVELQNEMVENFTWSFGGDASSDQAIAEWKKQTLYLKELAKVTSTKCGYLTKTIIQCPRSTGLKFRAGFEFIAGAWKMIYFVAGD